MTPGSPIRTFPAAWGTMTLEAKRHYLIAAHQAKDWHEASSLLSRHGHLVRAARKARQFARRARKQEIDATAQAIVDQVESVQVNQTCELCGQLLSTLTQFADGRREKKVFVSRAPLERVIVCAECAEGYAGEDVRALVAARSRT